MKHTFRAKQANLICNSNYAVPIMPYLKSHQVCLKNFVKIFKFVLICKIRGKAFCFGCCVFKHHFIFYFALKQ